MYTVIVADDEEQLRRALIRKVDWKMAGFEVIGEAENGIEALELVEKFEPDLLLTDIKMPFVSGIELARQVREIRPTTNIAFLSGFDDFSYAQQAIQYNILSYMLKPISSEELTQELIKIREKIDDKFRLFTESNIYKLDDAQSFLLPLILDDSFEETPEDEEQICQAAIQFGLIQSEDHELQYAIIVTGIIDQDGNVVTEKTSVSAIDHILSKYVRHISVFIHGRIVSVVSATQRGMEKYLHIMVEEIEQSIRRIMGVYGAVGVSRSYNRLYLTRIAYTEAMNAMGLVRKDGGGVQLFSDLGVSEEVKPEVVLGYINHIETLIKGGSEKELVTYMESAFNDMKQRRSLLLEANLFMIQLVGMIYKVIYAVVNPEEIQKLNIHMPLESKVGLGNFTDIQGRCCKAAVEARKIISEQRKTTSAIICEKVLSVIEKRYMEQELSLAQLSREIAVSPNYLSTLIKKTTGNTFVDLLTKKRVEAAKELLDTTSMKIREISEKCGYNDQHYFSYSFKKYTGASPNEFRRK